MNEKLNEEKMLSEKKLPQEKTLKIWKERLPWLCFTKDMRMVCTKCSSQEAKIRLMSNANLTFINGSTNYKPSTLQDHESTEVHKRAIREIEFEQATAAGVTLPPQKVVHILPENSAISEGFRIMSAKERTSVTKFFDIAYLIGLRGRPFTDFKDNIAVEKLHNVDFQAGAYENASACCDFVCTMGEYLFQTQITEKVNRVNFIGILCDGSTDVSVIEQEVVYVIFCDPDTMTPTLCFF